MKTKNQQSTSSENEAPDQANNGVIADDVSLLLFVRHSITAAVAGRRLLSKPEWNKTHSKLMEKCSSILKEYAGGK